MKKRLLCLLLCLVTVLMPVLASCSNNEDAAANISDEASESALTLTMWVVSEKEVSDATAATVSEALNAITKSKFKIQLVLKYFTEDEYRSELEKAILGYEENSKNRAETTAPETEAVGTGEGEIVVTDETMTNEFGLTVIKYPEVLQNQVDIIYIGDLGDQSGEVMFNDFVKNEWLAPLDNDLNNSSKKIKEYVAGTLLSAVKQNGITYAVPNNRAIGEYTYMLLNKELMDKYSHQGYVQAGLIDGFYNTNLFSFLNLISKFEKDSVVAIDSTYDYCLDLLAHYWSIDPETYNMLDEFSVFGYHYQSLEELTRGSVELGFNSLFEDESFTTNFLKLNQFKFDGYFGDAEAENKTAALTFATGDYSFLADYNEKGYCEYKGEKYYPIPVAYPTASTLDIYGNMFGVCSYTRDVSRSMKIITYLNTNTDFRNILQYGVEGIHYQVVEDKDGNKSAKRLNQDYVMDIYATGNAFITYPEPEMSADIWDSGKVQNRYSMVDPLLGLDFAQYAASTTPEEEKITPDSKLGYTVLHETGFSKDVLSQNEKIAKWLTDSDATGKGIYVLETTVADGQNFIYKYYVYNNSLTKKATFGVTPVREVEVTTNDKGKQTETLKNLDFIFTYESGTEASATGYELSVVSLYVKKSAPFEILGKVDDADVQLKVTSMKELISFDFLNTQEYSIELNQLRKGAIYRNTELMNWINDCDKNKDRTSTMYVLSYEHEPKDGKVERTYVVYLTGLTYGTSMEMLPTGDSGELNLTFTFTADEDNKLDTSEDIGDVNYLLYYVRVTADESVEVNPVYIVDSVKVELDPYHLEARTESNGDVDPDFDVVGTLDTELVKYTYELNNLLVEKLNACQNMEELTALVAELKILLSTGDTEPLESSFTILTDVVAKYKQDDTLKEFHRNIQYITSYQAVTIKERDPNSDSPLDLIDAKFKDLSGNTESYVYNDSPYAMYRAWLSANSYLPKTDK